MGVSPLTRHGTVPQYLSRTRLRQAIWEQIPGKSFLLQFVEFEEGNPVSNCTETKHHATD